MANNQLSLLKVLHDQVRSDANGHHLEVKQMGVIQMLPEIHPINGGLEVTNMQQYPKLALDVTTKIEQMGFAFYPFTIFPFVAYHLKGGNPLTQMQVWNNKAPMEKIQWVLAVDDVVIAAQPTFALKAIIKSIGLSDPQLDADLGGARNDVAEQLASFLRHVLCLALMEAKTLGLLGMQVRPAVEPLMVNNRFMKALTFQPNDPVGVWKYRGVDIKIPASAMDIVPNTTPWRDLWSDATNPTISAANFDYSKATPWVQLSCDNIPDAVLQAKNPLAVKLTTLVNCDIVFVADVVPPMEPVGDPTDIRLQKQLLMWQIKIDKLEAAAPNGDISQFSDDDAEKYQKYSKFHSDTKKEIKERAKDSGTHLYLKQKANHTWKAMYDKHNVRVMSKPGDTVGFFLDFRSWVSRNENAEGWDQSVACTVLRELIRGKAQEKLRAKRPNDEKFGTIDEFTKAFGVIFGANNKLLDAMLTKWRDFQYADKTEPTELVPIMNIMASNLECALTLANISDSRRANIVDETGQRQKDTWFDRRMRQYREGILYVNGKLKWDIHSVLTKDRNSTIVRYQQLIEEYQFTLNDDVNDDGDGLLGQVKSSINAMGARRSYDEPPPYKKQRRSYDNQKRSHDNQDTWEQSLATAGQKYRPPDNPLGRNGVCDTCTTNGAKGDLKTSRGAGHDYSQHRFIGYNWPKLLDASLSDSEYRDAKRLATERYHSRFRWTGNTDQYAAEARKYLNNNRDEPMNAAYAGKGNKKGSYQKRRNSDRRARRRITAVKKKKVNPNQNANQNVMQQNDLHPVSYNTDDEENHVTFA